mmetsp:Transcript_8058/g.22377  ORF Transcript_8058/g.22377 Transcript_8058/m.22377 type:complete len:355 (+) Transcript_8058:85-1149(+)
MKNVTSAPFESSPLLRKSSHNDNNLIQFNFALGNLAVKVHRVDGKGNSGDTKHPSKDHGCLAVRRTSEDFVGSTRHFGQVGVDKLAARRVVARALGRAHVRVEAEFQGFHVVPFKGFFVVVLFAIVCLLGLFVLVFGVLGLCLVPFLLVKAFHAGIQGDQRTFARAGRVGQGGSVVLQAVGTISGAHGTVFIVEHTQIDGFSIGGTVRTNTVLSVPVGKDFVSVVLTVSVLLVPVVSIVIVSVVVIVVIFHFSTFQVALHFKLFFGIIIVLHLDTLHHSQVVPALLFALVVVIGIFAVAVFTGSLALVFLHFHHGFGEGIDEFKHVGGVGSASAGSARLAAAKLEGDDTIVLDG